MSELVLTNLITAIATISGALIGGFFVYKSNIQKDELNKLRKDNYKYLQEIKAFYLLEQKYLEELEAKTSKTQHALKKEFRAKLTRKPTMTANNVDRILVDKKYEDLNHD